MTFTILLGHSLKLCKNNDKLENEDTIHGILIEEHRKISFGSRKEKAVNSVRQDSLKSWFMFILVLTTMQMHFACKFDWKQVEIDTDSAEKGLHPDFKVPIPARGLIGPASGATLSDSHRTCESTGNARPAADVKQTFKRT